MITQKAKQRMSNSLPSISQEISKSFCICEQLLPVLIPGIEATYKRTDSIIALVRIWLDIEMEKGLMLWALQENRSLEDSKTR